MMDGTCGTFGELGSRGGGSVVVASEHRDSLRPGPPHRLFPPRTAVIGDARVTHEPEARTQKREHRSQVVGKSLLLYIVSSEALTQFGGETHSAQGRWR